MSMLSPCRIQPNITNKRLKNVSKTNLDNNSHREHDLKRPQLTSNDLVKPDIKTKINRRNNIVSKSGSVHENIEVNEHYLDETLHKNDL